MKYKVSMGIIGLEQVSSNTDLADSKEFDRPSEAVECWFDFYEKSGGNASITADSRKDAEGLVGWTLGNEFKVTAFATRSHYEKLDWLKKKLGEIWIERCKNVNEEYGGIVYPFCQTN